MIKRLFIKSFLLLIATTTILVSVSIPHIHFLSKKGKQEVNVFVWGAFLSPETIASFEEAYGVRVNLHLCTNNDELISKIRRGNKSDFDVLFASDYAVKILRDSHLIKKIDKSRLNFFDRISPMLIGHEFDPKNEYSIPYTWEIYGIAENTNLIAKAQIPSLDQVFMKQGKGEKVAMIPDPIEASSIAAYYLHQKIHNLTKKQIKQTTDLLKKQRKWVEAYADYRAKYLVATENCPLALVKSSFLPDLTKESPEISYRIPKEGTFTSIENVVISASSQNEENAYDFLNHIFEKEHYHKTYEFCAMFPACLDSIEGSLLDIKEVHEIISEIEERKDLRLYDYIIPPQDLLETWISIKN